MSTAGRPTWNPAKGANRYQFPTLGVSAKDQRGHTQLKVRKPGQNTLDDIKKRDLKTELKKKEKKKDSKQDEEEDEEEEQQQIEDKKDEKKKREKNIDADDSDDSGDSSEEESDEEDDTAELMRELDKIKKEREEEAARKDMQQIQSDVREREDQALTSNPLLNENGDFNLKKRWYEDTIFKNQSRSETKMQKRFINDTIRNDFHKKFLTKYIK